MGIREELTGLAGRALEGVDRALRVNPKISRFFSQKPTSTTQLSNLTPFTNYTKETELSKVAFDQLNILTERFPLMAQGLEGVEVHDILKEQLSPAWRIGKNDTEKTYGAYKFHTNRLELYPNQVDGLPGDPDSLDTLIARGITPAEQMQRTVSHEFSHHMHGNLLGMLANERGGNFYTSELATHLDETYGSVIPGMRETYADGGFDTNPLTKNWWDNLERPAVSNTVASAYAARSDFEQFAELMAFSIHEADDVLPWTLASSLTEGKLSPELVELAHRAPPQNLLDDVHALFAEAGSESLVAPTALARVSSVVSKKPVQPFIPYQMPLFDKGPLPGNLETADMFHGTTRSWMNTPLQPASKGEAGGNLYGPGLYMTGNREIAETYGMNLGGWEFDPKPHVYGMDWRSKPNLLDLDAPFPEDVHDLFEPHLARRMEEAQKGRGKFTYGYYDEAGDLQYSTKEKDDAGWTQIMETAAAIDKQMVQESPGITTYGRLVHDLLDHNDSPSAQDLVTTQFNDQLYERGYHGFKHIGGRTMSIFDDHPVTIAFRPDQDLRRVGTQSLNKRMAAERMYRMEALHNQPGIMDEHIRENPDTWKSMMLPGEADALESGGTGPALAQARGKLTATLRPDVERNVFRSRQVRAARAQLKPQPSSGKIAHHQEQLFTMPRTSTARRQLQAQQSVGGYIDDPSRTDPMLGR